MLDIAFLEELLVSAQSELHQALISHSQQDYQVITAAISDAQRLIKYAHHQLESKK